MRNHRAGEGNLRGWERRPLSRLRAAGSRCGKVVRKRADPLCTNACRSRWSQQTESALPESELPESTPGSYPPGAPCRAELRTANLARANTFHAELPGWLPDDVVVSAGYPGQIIEGRRYSVSVKNDVAVAGITTARPQRDPAPVCPPPPAVGQPACRRRYRDRRRRWSRRQTPRGNAEPREYGNVYFTCADIDGAARRAVRGARRGSMLFGPALTPIGPMAGHHGSDGARFSLWGSDTTGGDPTRCRHVSASSPGGPSLSVVCGAGADSRRTPLTT